MLVIFTDSSFFRRNTVLNRSYTSDSEREIIAWYSNFFSIAFILQSDLKVSFLSAVKNVMGIAQEKMIAPKLRGVVFFSSGYSFPLIFEFPRTYSHHPQ